MKGGRYILALMPLGFSAAMARQKPNILVIIADDMARCELGCYGGQNLATPNIDRVANEGMLMTNNFASAAMSVPIRASMYTGLYPVRNGSYRNHKATYRGSRSVTHFLSELGYRVGRTGKDHPANQPKVYAFEKVPGFPVGCTKSHPPLATTDGIRDFMNRSADEPFCLFVCSINSHMPWDAGDASEFDPSKVILPPNCIDNQATRELFCDYLAEIRLFDNEVGRVMEALRESGKEDNTLVILLSEQGPRMLFGKWTCYNYGQSSAFIARYPGHIKPGSRSDALVQYEDILPTLIEVAGGERVDTLDGVSQLPVLLGKKREVRRWAFGLHNNHPEGPAYPIRSIQDKRYKLIVNLTPEVAYTNTRMMKDKDRMWTSWLETVKTDEHARWLMDKYRNRPRLEFYDLEKDPWELNNLASQPRYAKRIRTMQNELERWMKEQGDRGAEMDL